MTKSTDNELSGEMISDDTTAGMEIAKEVSDQDAVVEPAVPSSRIEMTGLDGTGGMDMQESANSVRKVSFAPLPPGPVTTEHGSMDLLLDVELDLSVELGRTSIPVKEVLQLGPGSIVELDKLAGEPVDIMVNGKLIARGEVVVVDENFGIRVTEIASRTERLNGLS